MEDDINENIAEIQKNTAKLIQKCTLGGDIYGTAPAEALKRIETIPFDRSGAFTEYLFKGEMDSGDLAEVTLKQVIIGALVEFWLYTFFVIYTLDYNKNPYVRKNRKKVAVHQLRFEEMIGLAQEVLFSNNNELHKWANVKRGGRNMVHLYLNKNIENEYSYKEDIVYLAELIRLIMDRIPEVEYCN